MVRNVPKGVNGMRVSHILLKRRMEMESIKMDSVLNLSKE